MIFTLVLILLIAVVAVMFALANQTLVHLVIFGYQADGQVGLFLLMALIIGIVLGMLFMAPSLISHRFTAARHRRRVAELESSPKESATKESKSQRMADMPPVASKPKDPAA